MKKLLDYINPWTADSVWMNELSRKNSRKLDAIILLITVTPVFVSIPIFMFVGGLLGAMTLASGVMWLLITAICCAIQELING